MSAPTRRTILTLGVGGALGLVSACGGGGKASSPSSTAGAGTSGPAMRVSPVAGFSSTPVWSSHTDRELSGLVPVADAGAAWFANHAWFLMATSHDAKDARVVALDPSTHTVAVSAPIPGLMSGTKTQWVTITHPAPALLIDTGSFQGTSCLVKLDGHTITTSRLPGPPSGLNPAWMGDVLFAPGTQNEGDGAIFDPRRATYTPVKAAHGGTVVGAVVTGGHVQPVELTGGDSDGDETGSNVYVGTRAFTSGIRDGYGSTDQAVAGMAWTHAGKVVLRVNGPTNGDIVYVPYRSDFTPATSGVYPRSGNPDQFQDDGDANQPQATSIDGAQAILPNGLLYDSTRDTVTRGVWTDANTMTWDLANTAVASQHLYGNATNHPHDASLPTAGAYTSTNGALTAQPAPGKTAPLLVLPDGDGFFHGASADVLSKM